ncbi:MAG: GntG family PLP-dependent aldolase [Kofleriaceae bacterium]
MDAIDLRSDTVTRPTAAMRRALAEAEVGDDVYGEDPTVRRLEERVAELLGKPAALFVPTGTMANQIALRAQLAPGDKVIVGDGAHVWLYESGALAALAGAQTHVVPGDGRFTAADVRAAFVPVDPYGSPTRVVAVENTHNMGGGLVWDAGAVAEVLAATHELGMVAHLDGARLWNAAVATGATERALAAGFSSVSVCLSKGLGAPAGSLVAGDRELITACHRLRKMYGGGMRQAGVLAAAGLHAIEHHRARLAQDHEHARRLADAAAELDGLAVDRARVMTNIVMVDLTRGTSAALVEAARRHGLLLGAVGPRRVRLVTHLEVDRAGVDRAIAALARAAGELAG